jgi:CPA2 family monovalent cation:H+ antiporter-2
MVVSKTLIVAAMMRRIEVDPRVAWRTGLLLAVGGEFGFALLAIALDSSVIDMQLGQIALVSVLFAMIAGAVLIRFNDAIATKLAGVQRHEILPTPDGLSDAPEQQVVIGGYGRVGHTIAVLLKASGVGFIVFDTDPKRVAQGRADGHPVLYGDISDPELLSAIHVDRASLVMITVDSSATALRAVSILRSTCPQVPIVVRARDLETSSRLLDAGATHAYPEAIEASLRLGATALRILRIPTDDIDLVVQEVRDWDYRPVIEEERDNRPAAERGP